MVSEPTRAFTAVNQIKCLPNEFWYAELSGIRRWLDDETVNATWLAKTVFSSDEARIAKEFPEARIFQEKD